MPTYVDANGNTVRETGLVLEVLIPGPALQAQIDARVAAENALRAKVAANKAALDALAVQCKDMANGTTAMPATLAGLTNVVKKLCEMNARNWYNETFGDP